MRRVCSLAVLVLAGCVAQPVIDTKAFAPPKSVAIVDIPKMNVVATVGVTVPWVPDNPGFHFTERADYYFTAGSPQGPKLPDYQSDINAQAQAQIFNTPRPMTPLQAGIAGGIAGGIVGGAIQSSAEETFRKSQTFGADILRLYPDYDLRADFMAALKSALEGRGVAVSLSSGGGDRAPRMRWPAKDLEGKPWPSDSAASFPAVDADLLVQVSPIAIYNAPGPLNAYRRNVSVGVVLYDGRSKRFLGRQNVWFTPHDGRFEYSKYDHLVGDLRAAAPALRAALLSLVPQVADIVSPKR